MKKIKWRKITHPAYEGLKEQYSWNKPFLDLLEEGKMFPFQTPLHIYVLSKLMYVGFSEAGEPKHTIVCWGLVGKNKWEVDGEERLRFKTLKEAKAHCKEEFNLLK